LNCDGVTRELSNYLDGLGETSLSHRRRVEAQPDGGILGERVPSAKTDLQAPLAEMIDAGQFLGEQDGMVEVVIEDQGTDSDSGRRLSDGHEWRQGRPPIGNVIPSVEDVEPGILGSTGL